MFTALEHLKAESLEADFYIKVTTLLEYTQKQWFENGIWRPQDIVHTGDWYAQTMMLRGIIDV